MAVICLLLFGCSPPSSSIQVQSVGVTAEGKTHSVRVVAGPKQSTLPTLAIVLHGTGESPESLARASKLDEFATAQNLILVYPSPANGSTWCVPNTLGEFADTTDLELVSTLIENRADTFGPVQDKVILIGLSAGGEFALAVAARQSQDIAAVVVHSGRKPNDDLVPSYAFRMMFICGERDEVVPCESVERSSRWYSSHGHQTEFLRIAGGEHSWAISANESIAEFLTTAH